MNEAEVKSSVVGPVLTDKADYILKSLRASRNNIRVLSDQIADEEQIVADIQETCNEMYAEAFVAAATEVNEQTGKLLNPNVDSQKAATTIKLVKARYDMHLLELGDHKKVIQKLKNTIVCEHERRGDLKTEVDLLKLLMAEAN